MRLSVARLAELTLERLAKGPDSSARIRSEIANELGLDRALLANRRFINLHAWALVRLQAVGAIEKLGKGRYGLREPATVPNDASVEPLPTEDGAPLPQWARDMIRNASARNRRRWNAPAFTREDLAHLWMSCGGCCSLTGLDFLDTQVGTGKARRPYAPSLDRIDSRAPYSRANCRLVLASVNFALNSFGDDVFERITDAAVAARQRKSHVQEMTA